MISGTYTMSVDIEYEYDETTTTREDAIDMIDYFGKVEVKLDNNNINNVKITSASLSVIDN